MTQIKFEARKFKLTKVQRDGLWQFRELQVANYGLGESSSQDLCNFANNYLRVKDYDEVGVKEAWAKIAR